MKTIGKWAFGFAASLILVCAVLAQSNIGGGGGGTVIAGAPLTAIYASPNCAASQSRCFQLPASGGILWDCTFTTGGSSTTITCPDGIFSPSMVGMIDFGTNICNNGGGCENSSTVIVPQGTISTYVSTTQVTVSSGATSSCTFSGTQSCVFAWGNDSTTVINNAWSAAAASPDCVDLQLSAGVWFISGPIANTTTNACKIGVGVARTGPGFLGMGPNSTIIVPTPGYSFASCTFGTSTHGCNFTSPGINLRDFQLNGLGNSVGGTHAVNLVELNTTNVTTNNVFNVSFSSWAGGAASSVGLEIYNSTPQPFLGVWLQAFGATNLQFDATSSAGVGIETNQLFVEDCNTACVNFNTGSTFMYSQNSVFGPTTGTNSNTILFTGAGTWVSDKDSVNYASSFLSTTNTGVNMNGGGTAYLDTTAINQPTNNTDSAMFLNNSAKVYATNSLFSSGTGHVAINCNNNAASRFYDMSYNIFNASQNFFNCNSSNVVGTGSMQTNLTTASTNFGTAIGTTNLVTAANNSGAPVTLTVTTRQVGAGTSCGAGTNTATPTISYTAPGGTAETYSPTVLSISANGAADSGSTASQTFTFTPKLATVITYAVASALVSTGCSPVPTYAMDLRLQ